MRSSLATTLELLTEDDWEFEFQPLRRGSAPQQSTFGFDSNDPSADVVVLFSGGADSLCAAIQAAAENSWRPMLVSHRSGPLLDARQRAVAKVSPSSSADHRSPM